MRMKLFLRFTLLSLFLVFVSCSTNETKILKNKCNGGDALACFELGKSLSKTNSELSRVYFEKACRSGHEKSCDYHLTSFLKKNKIKDSVNYYERECRSSNVYSCTVLGRIYFNLGNKTKGLNFYETSCGNGEPAACAFLSMEMFRLKQTDKELNYMERACTLGIERKGKKRTPMYCVLAGNSFARAGKFLLGGKYYSTACKFKDFDRDTLLYKMLACSRAGIYLKKVERDKVDTKLISQKTISESHDMYELGMGYLVSKCLSPGEKFGFKDCYDVAGAYSIEGNPGQSLKYLELAFQKGFKEWKYILEDHELSFMRKTLPFKKLVNKYYRQFQENSSRRE